MKIASWLAVPHRIYDYLQNTLMRLNFLLELLVSVNWRVYSAGIVEIASWILRSADSLRLVPDVPSRINVKVNRDAAGGYELKTLISLSNGFQVGQAARHEQTKCDASPPGGGGRAQTAASTNQRNYRWQLPVYRANSGTVVQRNKLSAVARRAAGYCVQNNGRL